uniref:(northern house mosquito) hypothetical protein n=1 Tax=Culex pipiens TaxID=7175 RepID=A0A8D8HIL7_CULPI
MQTRQHPQDGKSGTIQNQNWSRQISTRQSCQKMLRRPDQPQSPPSLERQQAHKDYSNHRRTGTPASERTSLTTCNAQFCAAQRTCLRSRYSSMYNSVARRRRRTTMAWKRTEPDSNSDATILV